MSYTEDLNTAVMCHKAVLFVLERMNTLKTSYPQLNLAMTLATEGYVRTLQVECEDGPDGVCTVNTEKVGGLPEILDYLEEAIEWLSEEVHLEEVDSDEGERLRPKTD